MIKYVIKVATARNNVLILVSTMLLLLKIVLKYLFTNGFKDPKTGHVKTSDVIFNPKSNCLLDHSPTLLPG